MIYVWNVDFSSFFSGEELCNSPCCLFDNMLIFRCLLAKQLELFWNENTHKQISLRQTTGVLLRNKYSLRVFTNADNWNCFENIHQKYSPKKYSPNFFVRADNWTALTNVRLLRREWSLSFLGHSILAPNVWRLNMHEEWGSSKSHCKERRDYYIKARNLSLLKSIASVPHKFEKQ